METGTWSQKSVCQALLGAELLNKTVITSLYNQPLNVINFTNIYEYE